MVRSEICEFLASQGHIVAESATLCEAPTQLGKCRPEAVILDASFPNGDVLALLRRIKSEAPQLPVIVLLPRGSGEVRVRAVEAGAEHVLIKPVLPIMVYEILTMVLARHASSTVSPARRHPLHHALDPFIGTSSAIRRLREFTHRVLRSDSPILLQGETGSGKGVLANWIHRNGPRAQQPFLDLNCAGLSRELLESELFGHEKGAFTSAVTAKRGLLEVADHGTVFLDEIGDIDLQVQPKLLKVLEDRTFRRVGNTHDQSVDVRLISATHRQLLELVRQQKFRQDLYFRVTIVPIHVPALRDRKEDIPLLARDLLGRISSSAGGDEVEIEKSALDVLQRYPWPGNIRELRNVLERSLLLVESGSLSVAHLQLASASAAEMTPKDCMGGTLKQMERAYIHFVLQDEQGSIDRSARRLGIPRSSLYAKMKRLQIPNGTGRNRVLAGTGGENSAIMEI